MEKKQLDEKRVKVLEQVVLKLLKEQMDKGIATEGFGDYLHGALRGVKDVVKKDFSAVKDKAKDIKKGVTDRIDQVKKSGEKAEVEANNKKAEAKKEAERLEGEAKLKDLLYRVNEFNKTYLPKIVLKRAKIQE